MEPLPGRLTSAASGKVASGLPWKSPTFPVRRAGCCTLDPIPLRGYAFCIIIGVFVAVWLGNKRWVARGGRPGTVADIAVWAVPFGLVGGRLYHVITDYELYFSEGRDWVDAFKIWEGGLGIWGAIALGALGAWIGCRRRGIPLPAWADALAPGIALAQAIGRWGNWFNQELYGRETTVCRGRCTSPPRPTAGSRATTTRRSCTSPCGASASRCWSSGRTAASRWATDGRSRCTSRPTAWAASGSSTCGSTTPTTSWACG